MPKVSNEQNAVMDVMDFIHFHTVYTAQFLTSEEEIYYQDLISDVQDAALRISSKSSNIDAARHYLLCGLEVALGMEDTNNYNPSNIHDAITNKEMHICLALLISMASEHGINKSEFSDNMFRLIDKYNSLNLPITVRYRLAVNVNCIINPLDHLFFFSFVNNANICHCAKYRKCENNEVYASAVNRVGLVMEFEIFRKFAKYSVSPGGEDEITFKIPDRNIPEALREQIVNDYKEFIENIISKDGILFKFPCHYLNDEKKVLILLINIKRFFRHKRMFKGTLAKWSGTWGALLIELLRLEHADRAIYCEVDNSKTISAEAASLMDSLRFKVSARTLYLRYKSVRNNELKNIIFYKQELLKQKIYLKWSEQNFAYTKSLTWND
ncbi:hypothetical protein [Enterobacter mori]|uniref:hypothetical protein n=1 Tax=Enterobacter mori TaxID=539813 RepID=UPI0030768265